MKMLGLLWLKKLVGLEHVELGALGEDEQRQQRKNSQMVQVMCMDFILQRPLLFL